MFGAYNNAKAYFQSKQEGKIYLYQHFICGAIGGYACAFVANPVEIIKSRLQVQYADSASQRYKGPIDCIKKVYHNNGILGFYSGTVVE